MIKGDESLICGLQAYLHGARLVIGLHRKLHAVHAGRGIVLERVLLHAGNMKGLLCETA